ncbi:uncharacterized protein LOC123865378 isoform X1 [Maniola jurtina]|uniref:uncharacterized protein LOC123865378 isoform X1 n=1 Tax=Maniola jurtina TaxID=191418 RepID=UPI001E68688A|nr:uncharacterized protein LOC123865378 isoform X1 [Maniola jurtina]
MSIKSQKSLNEECSEIFERSYSVRSVSEESLTCDEDEESLSRELLRKLTPAVLSKLRRCFKKAREKNAAAVDIDRKVEEVMRVAAAEEGIQFAAPAPAQPPILCLDEKGFVSAVDNIFGHRKYSPHARQLFQTLDSFGSGRVWWRQLVTRLVAAGARTTSTRCERWTPVTVQAIRRLDHCKRETIVKLVSIERENSFCYTCVSRGGRVGVYSAALQPLHDYEIFYHRTGVHRRVKNCWITDAIYLNDVQSLLFSASDRSLTIYDVTTVTHTPVYCITGLPNIPTCLAYNSALNGGESELMFGTERGDVTRMRFLLPRLSLFYSKTQDSTNYYFWMELSSPPHSHYCSISTWRGVHARSVRRVSYARDGDIVWSCSHDSTVGVRARHAPGLLKDYVFKVQRGISCFHMVAALHLLATGSPDGLVRLWETQGSLFASLSVPGSPAVLDVAVIVSMEIVVAYCSNCFVHIWDLYEECLLQTVKIKFPFLGVLGKKPDFGTISIHPGPPRKKEAEEDVASIPSGSRRGSSVYQGSTGGLLLQPEPGPAAWDQRGLERDPENLRFNRGEILVTCCDYVCSIALRQTDEPPLAPPGDTLRARRPSFWELPADLIAPPASVAKISKPCPPSPRFLAPVAAEETLEDLDELLEKAGLQGILEKDFVLMRGLKHDLNKKLHEMESDKEATRSAVNAGAPYLALKSYEPVPLPSFDHLAEQYSRVMSLFPESITLATPSGSEFSSPRNSKSFKL